MRRRIVGFLGPGPYHEVTYELDRRPSKPRQLVLAALADTLTAPGESEPGIVVLGTDKTESRWLGRPAPDAPRKKVSSSTALFRDLGRRAAVFWRVLPAEDRAARWQLFAAVTDALSPEPLEQLGESEPPDEIAFDVTHGFRAQPLLGLAALGFVLSEWTRREIERPPRVRVFYGAYDPDLPPPAGTPAAIWDLTDFVLIGRWNAALDSFLRFGRADDIERLAAAESKEAVADERAAGREGSELSRASLLRKFGQAAKRVADDLITVRLQSLFTQSVPALLRVLSDEGAGSMRERLPVLAPAFDELRVRLADIPASAVLDRGGVRASAALARLYGRLQRFAEQAVVVREGLVSHFAVATGMETAEPSCESCKAKREMVEHRWGELAHAVCQARAAGGATPSEQGPPAPAINEGVAEHLNNEAWRNVDVALATQGPRNDLLHGGIRDHPSEAGSLADQLKRSSQQLDMLLARDVLEE